MPTISLELVSVRCIETEDHTGADEIYVIGGIAAVGAANTGQPPVLKFKHDNLPRRVTTHPAPGTGGTTTVSQPTMSMNNGDTWTVGETLVKEAVPFGKSVVAIWLYDQDSAEDVEIEDADAAAEVIESAGSALAPLTEGASVVAGFLAGLIVRLGARLMALDDDDLLGSAAHELDAPVPIPGDHINQHRVMMFLQPQLHELKATLDGANYIVQYRILTAL